MTRRDLLFAAVAAPVALPAQADANRQFVELANDYITRFTEATPVFATFLGEHRTMIGYQMSLLRAVSARYRCSASSSAV